MKPRLLSALVSTLLLGSAAYMALASESSTSSTAAHVTMTVTNFRSWTSPAERGYTDATTTLAPHAVAALVDEEGLPTFHMKRAATLEITVESATPGKRYHPLGSILRSAATARISRRTRTEV